MRNVSDFLNCTNSAGASAVENISPIAIYLLAVMWSRYKKIAALEETNDGFAIAQKDLELRGPGQFFGTIQSGLPDIAMENLTNVKLIKFSQMEARDLLNKDPELKKHPAPEMPFSNSALRSI